MTEARPTPFLSIVIPAYNEEDHLPGSLRKAISYLDRRGLEWEILVVDDGSTDRTSSIVESFAQHYPNVRLLRNPHGGKGSAVKRGMLAAAGEYSYLADADFSTPIEDVENLTHARFLGYRVREFPVSWTYVSGSQVRVFRDTWRMLYEVLRIRWMAWRSYGSKRRLLLGRLQLGSGEPR